jgi:hypothetical protein
MPSAPLHPPPFFTALSSNRYRASHGDGTPGKGDLGNANAPKSGNRIAQTTNCIFHPAASGPSIVSSTPNCPHRHRHSPNSGLCPEPSFRIATESHSLNYDSRRDSNRATTSKAKVVGNLLPRAAHLPSWNWTKQHRRLNAPGHQTPATDSGLAPNRRSAAPHRTGNRAATAQQPRSSRARGMG